MTTLTRHDIQSVVEQARNRLMDHIASRQDMLQLQDTVKSLGAILHQNQILLRQQESQSLQLVRRAAAMESRMILLEREIQQLRRTVIHAADQPAPRMSGRVIVTGTQNPRFVYSPTA